MSYHSILQQCVHHKHFKIEKNYLNNLVKIHWNDISILPIVKRTDHPTYHGLYPSFLTRNLSCCTFGIQRLFFPLEMAQSIFIDLKFNYSLPEFNKFHWNSWYSILFYSNVISSLSKLFYNYFTFIISWDC